jgi:hypothetical protein
MTRVHRRRTKLTRCSQTGLVILFTELEAKIVLAQRMYRDKGETRYFPCTAGNHFHLTAEPENETTSESLTSKVAV